MILDHNGLDANGLPPVRAKGMVHRGISDLAKQIAREEWEKLARQNVFYAANPKPGPFVRKFWPQYVHLARQILVGMLGSPKYDQASKDRIYGMLLLDSAINPKEMAVPEKKPVFRLTK